MLSYSLVFWGDVMDIIATLLQSTYDFMNSIYVPGFNISFMSVLLGACAAMVSIGLLKLIFGLGNSSVSSLGRSVRGGNNKNIRISNDRKGDTH